MAEAKVREVIELIETRGSGVENDPYRTVVVYLTLDGQKLAELDAWLESTRLNSRIEKLERALREVRLLIQEKSYDVALDTINEVV